jgi:predicted DNA-binding antitoxin AbrB/MazE fold protein
MLSIKGIYDGEKIIPQEPINLGKGEQFEVIITFIEPIKNACKKDLKRFCGIWQDERNAEEIIEQIYQQREKFNIQEVKL